jgi:hypothetical protein
MKTKRNQRARGEFSEKVANILSGYVSELPPEEQEARVKAFENAVARVCRRGTSPRVRRTPEIHPTRLALSRE